MPYMKQAVFITNPLYVRTEFKHPWAQGLSFTSKDISLPQRNDVLSFLRDFRVKKPLSRAVVRATALGVFDLFLNGTRIGTKDENGNPLYDELKPGWTDYRFRVFGFTYDVTDLCRENNLFTAEVSSGWWTGRISFGAYGYKPTAFCGEIELFYEDGTTELYASDESWLVTTDGPIRTGDIWDGEYYDARIPAPKDGIPASAVNATRYHDATCEIAPHVGETIRVSPCLERAPQSAVLWCGSEENGTPLGKISTRRRETGVGCEKALLRAGESLTLDFAQNMVGRPRITLSAESGTEIEIFCAEMLNDTGDPERGNDGPEGSAYVKNYRSALSRLVYIASGSGEEIFAPTHTFHGFRYLEIRSTADVTIHKVRGEVLRSDLKETSSFSCSNAEVNQLFSNILWGQRGNYLSIPTDCPQRDERLGWTGDTQIFCGAGSYNADVRGFFKKWLGDARHSQIGENGAYCDVIPRVFHNHNNGNAAWGDAGLIVPYRLYLMYNDTDTILEHYASMEDYMTYLSRFGMNGPNTAYGDWLNYEVTDKRYIAVAYYAYDAELMAFFSRLLAEKCPDRADFYKEREAHYASLHEKIRLHFLSKYYKDDDLTLKTQTTYLLALKFNLIPAEGREKAIRALEKKITDNDYTLSTGFVGTGVLNQTLQECGLSGLAYSLLLQTKDPSWLYSVRQGATTIWERWNSYTLARGFGDVNMNSFNHYAYGAVAEWMFSGMLGILPDEAHPGFSHFRLAPTPDMRSDNEIPAGQERITHAEGHYDSISGTIRSAWYTENGAFVYRFTIPEGTIAEIALPNPDGEAVSILLNGLSFTEEELSAKEIDGRICFTRGAGDYTIILKK